MADDIKLPEPPEPDDYITIKIIGRDVEVNAYRDSTLRDYARAAVAAFMARQYPLPDDLFPDSKDWLAGDYAARVEWLHVMYEKKRAEVDALIESAIASERRRLSRIPAVVVCAHIANAGGVQPNDAVLLARIAREISRAISEEPPK